MRALSGMQTVDMAFDDVFEIILMGGSLPVIDGHSATHKN